MTFTVKRRLIAPHQEDGTGSDFTNYVDGAIGALQLMKSKTGPDRDPLNMRQTKIIKSQSPPSAAINHQPDQ